MNMEDSHEFSLHNMPMDKQNWKKKVLVISSEREFWKLLSMATPS